MSGYSTGGTTFVGGAITSALTAADGTGALPAYSFTGNTQMGMFRNANTLGFSSAGNQSIFGIGTSGAILPGTTPVGGIYGWTSSSLTAGLDTGLARNAAGVVEVNSGTAGTFKDLKLQRQLVGGTAPTVASTGLGTGTVAVDAGSTDTAGIITLSPTGSPAGTGVVTLTFSAALGGNAGPAYICMPVNGTGAWQAQAVIIGTTLSTTVPTFTWTNGATPTVLTAGSTYKIAYIAIGK